MNPKVFLVLAALTTVTTIAAVFAVLSQPTATTLQFVDEPAFPALRENPDAVAKIILSSPAGDHPGARDRRPLGGARAPRLPGRPQAGARSRGGARRHASDRAQDGAAPALRSAGGRGPDAENAESELVRLEAANGTVLAEAIIGKQRYRLTGTEPSGTYLRRPDEAQSWLASGGIQIDREVARWLDGEIVDLDPEAIRRIEIQRAGESSYAAVRDNPGGELHLAGLAGDETLKEDADLTRLTGALSSVRLDDVRPREQLTWPAEQHTARVETFDGVELSVRLAQIEDGYWATFEARAVAPSNPTASADTGAAQPTARRRGRPSRPMAAPRTRRSQPRPPRAGQRQEGVGVRRCVKGGTGAASRSGAAEPTPRQVGLPHSRASVQSAEHGALGVRGRPGRHVVSDPGSRPAPDAEHAAFGIRSLRRSGARKPLS